MTCTGCGLYLLVLVFSYFCRWTPQQNNPTQQTQPQPNEQVLWTDEVSETPVSSTRQFINTFLLSGDDGGVSGDGDIAEGAVLSRLPYDRVSINGTTPLTFISNDVVRRRKAFESK